MAQALQQENLTQSEILLIKKQFNDKISALEESDRKDRLAKWKTYQSNRLSAERRIQKIELDLLEDGIDKQVAINTANFENQIEDVKNNEKLKASEKLILTELLGQQQADKEAELREKEKERKEKIRDEETADLIALQDAQFALMQEISQTEKEKEIEDLVASYEEKFLLAEGNAQLELDLQAKLQEDIAIIEQEARDKKALEDKKAADEARALDKASAIQKAQFALGALDVISQAAELFNKGNEKDAKKAFMIQKAAALATAVINTGLAVTGALTAGGNPLKLATGAQFVEAGIAAAAGAVQIATIASSQFNSPGNASSGGASGGGGGGSSASAASQSTPSFDFFGSGDGSANNVSGTESVEAGGQDSTPILEVSVVEITNAQNKLNKISESGTL
jgi:hypothetical protein